MADKIKLTDEQKKYFADRINGFSNVLNDLIELDELEILEKADEVMNDFVFRECFIGFLSRKIK